MSMKIYDATWETDWRLLFLKNDLICTKFLDFFNINYF